MSTIATSAHIERKSNTDNETLLSKFTQALLANMYNRWTDNYDECRWGRKSRRSVIKEQAAALLKKFGLVCVESSFARDVGTMQALSREWAGFEYLFNSLDDDWSRELLPVLLAHRVLGSERVRLPVNDSDYWQNRERVKQTRVGKKSISFAGLSQTLDLFDLKTLGFPIELFCTNYPELMVTCTFVLKQYEYRRRQIACFAEPGDYVIDAGGCWGDTALYFAHKVGRMGRVYSFEFIPSNLNIFEMNLELNPNLADLIEIVPSPLWSSSDSPLYYWDCGCGSRISSEPSPQCTQKVSTLSIDDFVLQNSVPRVDFIKMDIEGAEQSALLGAAKTLTKFRPKLAISIYHRLEDFYKVPQYIESLKLGYKFYIDHFTIHGEETMLFAVPS
jgi:FkbM family methyltransferase